MADQLLKEEKQQPILVLENKQDLLLFNAVLTRLLKDCVEDPNGTWLKWINSKDDEQMGNAAFTITRLLIGSFNENKKRIMEELEKELEKQLAEKKEK